MPCYRNATFVIEECLYFVTTCNQEYLAKNRGLNSRNIITGSHQRCRDLFEKAMLTKGNLEVVDDLRRLEQNPQSLTIFPQQSGVPVAT